jgi:hypothetical protein
MALSFRSPTGTPRSFVCSDCGEVHHIGDQHDA